MENAGKCSVSHYFLSLCSFLTHMPFEDVSCFLFLLLLALEVVSDIMNAFIFPGLRFYKLYYQHFSFSSCAFVLADPPASSELLIIVAFFFLNVPLVFVSFPLVKILPRTRKHYLCLFFPE